MTMRKKIRMRDITADASLYTKGISITLVYFMLILLVCYVISVLITAIVK